MKKEQPFDIRRSISQVAKRLGLSAQEVRAHVYRGALVAREYDGRLMVHEDELLAWARGGR
jgi:hypothetical protein